MVSNALFYSGKALDVRYRAPFGVMILVILGFVLVSSDPPVALFGLFIIYALSGYIFWIWQRFFSPKKKPLASLSDN
jgi:CDP-diacylglycerol--serine O-phosphatidyltransferase